MTKTHTTPATAAGPEVAAGAAQFLTPITLGLQALAVNGKQAHWNVRGANFIAIHELLDTVVAHAQAGADEAAERIVALGIPVTPERLAEAGRMPHLLGLAPASPLPLGERLPGAEGGDRGEGDPQEPEERAPRGPGRHGGVDRGRLRCRARPGQ